jgi:Uma2 family endonuclease
MLARKTMSVEEYFEFEKTAEVRHEFVDGTLLEMPGVSRVHNRIVVNIVKALDDIALRAGCELHPTDVMTRTQNTRYRYPDIVVTCAPGDNSHILENPCFLVEVTSDSTSDSDHGPKLEEYTKLPSMQRYAIVSQGTRQVVLYKRDGANWKFEVFTDSGEFDIPCLDTKLTLEQIYAGLLETETN